MKALISVYMRGIDPKVYNEIIDRAVPSRDMWGRSKQHLNKLEDEGVLFENLLPKLTELTQPSLLIAGQFDPVCCEEQRAAYAVKTSKGQTVMFEHSAHFPRLEEPDKYTGEIVRFIMG